MSEEFAVYMPHIRRRRLEELAGWEKRREKARAAAQDVAVWLREQHGATQIILFGSVVREGLFDARSDIDLAIAGLSPRRYFLAVANVSTVCPDFQVDLIDLADCSPALRSAIMREGLQL